MVAVVWAHTSCTVQPGLSQGSPDSPMCMCTLCKTSMNAGLYTNVHVHGFK